MRTQGQARLLRLTKKYTQGKIARKCGVSQAVISLWISGQRTPTYDNRKTLLTEYEIGLDDWERPAEVAK